MKKREKLKQNSKRFKTGKGISPVRIKWAPKNQKQYDAARLGSFRTLRSTVEQMALTILLITF